MEFHHNFLPSNDISATPLCFSSTTPTLGHLRLFWLTQLTSTDDERNSRTELISFSDPWDLVGCNWARKSPCFLHQMGRGNPLTPMTSGMQRKRESSGSLQQWLRYLEFTLAHKFTYSTSLRVESRHLSTSQSFTIIMLTLAFFSKTPSFCTRERVQ